MSNIKGQLTTDINMLVGSEILSVERIKGSLLIGFETDRLYKLWVFVGCRPYTPGYDLGELMGKTIVNIDKFSIGGARTIVIEADNYKIYSIHWDVEESL